MQLGRPAPRSDEEEGARGAPRPAAPPAPVRQAAGSPFHFGVRVFDAPARVLVVDDDPILREIAMLQLAQPGVTLVAAGDGEEAWALLEGPEAFDLVLSDLEMPVLSGFGLVERLRADPRHADLPVVVVTSRDDMFAVDRAYEVGATSFVAKPVNWRMLGHQLRYVLRAARTEREAQGARAEAERAATLKTNLLGLLQHETRTPLHALVGYAGLLRGRDAPPALRAAADEVAAAAGELGDVLGRVFRFAQLAAGTMRLDRETMRLDHLLEEVLASARAEAAAAEVALRREDPRAAGATVGETAGGTAGDARGAGGPAMVPAVIPAVISCDVGHLSAALREVVGFALARTPRGGVVRIEVEAPASKSPGASSGVPAGASTGTVVVVVRDDAPPPPGALDALLAGRDQILVDPTAGRLGLGLPIAERIVALHGGALTLVADEAGGTAARVALPTCAPD